MSNLEGNMVPIIFFLVVAFTKAQYMNNYPTVYGGMQYRYYDSRFQSAPEMAPMTPMSRQSVPFYQRTQPVQTPAAILSNKLFEPEIYQSPAASLGQVQNYKKDLIEEEKEKYEGTPKYDEVFGIAPKPQATSFMPYSFAPDFQQSSLGKPMNGRPLSKIAVSNGNSAYEIVLNYK